MKTLKTCVVILAAIFAAVGTAYGASSELRYAISGLKVAAGYSAADADADTDGNGTVGINDVICSLQIAAGFRLESPDITLLAPTATDRLTVAWLPVSDDFTSEDNISYEIHLSKQERFQPSADTLKATATDETQKDLAGLETGTTYHVLAVAVAKDGNRSIKRDYRSVTTFAEPVIESSTTKFNVDSNLGLTSAAQDGNNYIYADTAEATPPEVGSVLFGKVGEDTYLRKVEAINTAAGTIVVQTGEAELAEVLEQATVSSEIKMFDVDEAAGRSVDRSDISAKRSVSSDGSRRSVVRWKDELLVAEQIDYASENDEVSVSPGLRSGEHVIRIGKDSEESAGVNASVAFTPKLEIEATWKKFSLTSGKVMARGAFSASISAFYNFNAEGSFEKQIPFFSKSYISRYFLGPIPVYQKTTFTLSAVISASASSEVKADAKASATASIEMGAVYNSETKKWDIISPSSNFDKSFTIEMDVQGGVHSEVRLIPKIEVQFYGVRVSDISLEPFMFGDINAEAIGKIDILQNFEYLNTQLTKLDFGLQAESFIGISLGPLSKKFPQLERTKIWESPQWLLFSLPKLEISSCGSAKINDPIKLSAKITDGANNPFNENSIRWNVYPNEGSITSNGRTATFIPKEKGTYTIFFSGHSKLGDPFGRQFAYTEVNVGDNAEGMALCYGENTTITEMNWHEAYSTALPGELPPDSTEFESSGNTMHTFVSSSSPFNESGACNPKSGNADAKLGVQFIVKGEEGQGGMADITINLSTNMTAGLDGGGTADSILWCLGFPCGEYIYRTSCSTHGITPPILCKKPFQKQESITFQTHLDVGQSYQIGVGAYSHADVCGGSDYASCDVTIQSITIEFP